MTGLRNDRGRGRSIIYILRHYAESFPYTKEYENSIELLEYTDSQVEQYMSLVHESDRALQKLIEDLEKSEEPTVVVFLEIIFQHCPKIFTSMYLERQMRK